MPCIFVNTSYLKDILAALPELPPHNWLITDLECYDYNGWDGCEKWANTEMFLTDEELRRDVNLRNMPIIWGVFSAIPAEYTEEEISGYPRPEAMTPRYMRDHIEPQHPLAILEIYADDAYFILVTSRDAALLQPLYDLPCETEDEEASNQAMNAQLRRVQDILRKSVPDVSPEIANEVQWELWHRLLCGKDDVPDAILRTAVMEEYHKQILPEHTLKYGPYWDPYTQE